MRRCYSTLLILILMSDVSWLILAKHLILVIMLFYCPNYVASQYHTTSYIDFLTGRNQLCRVGANLSHFVNINRSIIQGSGLAPSLYIVMNSDMKTVGGEIAALANRLQH